MPGLQAIPRQVQAMLKAMAARQLPPVVHVTLKSVARSFSVLPLRVRKIQVAVEETIAEHGEPLASPTLKATAAVALLNPYAGQGYVADLGPMFDLGALAGELCASRAATALRHAATVHPSLVDSEITGYGKACIVGVAGELEHSAAILHPKFGAPVRAAVGGGDDIIPGTKKMGGVGSSITVPITHKNHIFSFPHMDSVDVNLADAPRPDEMVVIVALSIGTRPLARIGDGPSKVAS